MNHRTLWFFMGDLAFDATFHGFYAIEQFKCGFNYQSV